jgi:hypothetical protein
LPLAVTFCVLRFTLIFCRLVESSPPAIDKEFFENKSAWIAYNMIPKTGCYTVKIGDTCRVGYVYMV